MACFKDEVEMYEIYRAFFERLSSHPEIGPALGQSGLIVSFRVDRPSGLLTLNCRNAVAAGRPFTFSFGPTEEKPDLTLVAEADTIHGFWLGKVNVVTAMVTGKIKAEGNIASAMKLMPVLKSVFELYPSVLKEIGREDLATV